MLPSPCFVLSDAHLGHSTPEVERDMRAFLAHVGERGGSLVINGDLFEFWFEWQHVIPRAGFRVLAALADLRERGVPVVMLAGNHDCWGGDVLRQDVGVDYLMGPWRGGAAGWSAHIEHGDGLRPKEDRRYRALRSVLRHPLAMRAFRGLPADFSSGLAYGSSDASRTHGAHDEGAGLREIAFARLARERDVELVIYAHSHTAHLERALAGGVYANAGAWVTERTFLEITPLRIALRRWDGSPEGAYLHALDRTTEEPLAEP